MVNLIPVLVTGGAGYIGSHVCKALAGAGYFPIAFDSLVHGHEWAVKWGPLEVGDINDFECLFSAVNSYKIEAIVHLAAFAYVNESVEDPEKYYQNNTLGMLNLLRAVRRAKIERFVFSSSCAVYGEPNSKIISENWPRNPINTYGFTKHVGERMLQDFMTAYGGSSIALRYFNAAGADPDCEIGEDHDPEPHLIPRVLDVALKKTEELTINGRDYATPDGTCVRDYVHVTDLADGHVQALNALREDTGSKAYNLGAGKGNSILEVIATAREILGADVPFTFGARRLGDPAILVADTALAVKELGWRPKHSDIRFIMKTALQWACRSQV